MVSEEAESLCKQLSILFPYYTWAYSNEEYTEPQTFCSTFIHYIEKTLNKIF